MEMKKIKRKSLSEEVLESIINYIKTNELKVGDRIPTESELTSALGVSRSSVREAIKALNFTGALVSTPGKGTYIRKPIPEMISMGNSDPGLVLAAKASIKDIMEIRTALEILAFDLALDRASPEDIARLEDTLNSLKCDVRSGKPWAISGISFHICLAEMSNNTFLVDMINSLSRTIGQYKDALYNGETTMEPYIAEHQNIFDALQRRDKKAGHKAIKEHMRITEKDLSILVNAETASTFIEIGNTR